MKEFFTFTFYLTVFFQCSLYLTSKMVQLETGAAATLHDKKEWHKKAHGKKNESPNWRMLSKRMKNRKRDTMRNLPNDKIRKGEVDNVCMHVCVHVYVCVRVCVCAHLCMCVWVWVWMGSCEWKWSWRLEAYQELRKLLQVHTTKTGLENLFFLQNASKYF